MLNYYNSWLSYPKDTKLNTSIGRTIIIYLELLIMACKKCGSIQEGLLLTNGICQNCINFQNNKNTSEINFYEPILVIHGTGAKRSLWFRRDSDFCRSLDSKIESMGGVARTWDHLSEKEEEFTWSGENLESERRDAATKLYTELSKLENHPKIKNYHIVAHSHAGNILHNAIICDSKVVPQKLIKLKNIVYLGTPFIEKKTILLKSVTILILLSALLFPLITGIQLNAGENLSLSRLETEPNKKIRYIYFMQFVSVGLAIIIAIHFRNRFWSVYNKQKLRQSGMMRTSQFYISSKYDEAYSALLIAAKIKKSARSYSKSILGGLKIFKISKSNISIFDALFSLYLPFLNKPFSYSKNSNWNLIRKAFRRIISLYNLFAAFLITLLTSPFRVSIFFTKRLIIYLGLKQISSSAMGDDILGEEIITFTRKPSGIDITEIKIPDRIEEQLKRHASHENTILINDVLRPLNIDQRNEFIDGIVETVESTLSNQKLVHSQYYENDEIISLIAKKLNSNK